MRILATIFLLFALEGVHGQSIYNNENRVLASETLVFYGYDFSHFKLIDEMRKGQDIASFTSIWVNFLQEHINQDNMLKMLSKKDVVFDFSYITKNNRMLSSDSLWSRVAQIVDSSKIANIIAEYDITQKQGVGFTIIFECMNNYKKTTSGYFTFFDIATREVLWAEYISSYDGNSYNRVVDWAIGIFVAYKNRFLPIYKKKYKAYIKKL